RSFNFETTPVSTYPGRRNVLFGFGQAWPPWLLRADPANDVGVVFNEPEIVKVVGSGGDAERLTAGGRGRELGDGATGGDTRDIVPLQFCEPEVVIGANGDVSGLAAGGRDRELGDGATGGDTPDIVPSNFCEPEVTIRPIGDAMRHTARGRD